MRALPERIQLKSPDQIALMREAGLVVARALREMRGGRRARASRPSTWTRWPGTSCARPGATPSFLNYHGYPAVICASVNERVVHGIPSAAEKLRDG